MLGMTVLRPERYSGGPHAGDYAPVSAGDTTQKRASSDPGTQLTDDQTYTVDDAIEHVGVGRFQLGLLFYTGLVWFADAMELMLLSYISAMVRGDFNLTADMESLLTSGVFVGMTLGSSFWGGVSDTRGRRTAFFFTATTSAIFAYLSAGAPNFWILVAMRLLLGVGIGGAAVADTLFLEFIPTSGRSRWMSALGLFWTLGGIAEAGLAWALLGSHGWRTLLAVSATPQLLLLLLFPWLPESPRYLLVAGRAHEAQALLARLARANGRDLPPGRLVASSQGAAAAEVAQSPGRSKARGLSRDLLGTLQRLLAPPLRRTSLLLAPTWLLNMLAYYGLVLLATELSSQRLRAQAGGTDTGSEALSTEALRDILITSVGELPALLVAALAMEGVGRRLTTAVGLAGAGASALVLIAGPQGPGLIAIMFVGRMLVSVAFNTLMVYTKELYPTSLRTTSFSTCNAIGRIGGMLAPFIVIKLCSTGQTALAEAIVGGCCLLAAALVAMVSIETKGRALADTEHDFMQKQQMGPGDAEAGSPEEKAAFLGPKV